MCLHEKQLNQYEDNFKPYVSRKGYEGCFKGNTLEAIGRNGNIDGCAILFLKKLFNLRYQLVIEYNMIAKER